ncbi:MAG: transposase [Cyclobacteriaceae bacterium]|nr:transposase [Cyclobacteriaceae bacterium]
MEVYAKQHPDFITTTCLEWKPVLHDDRFKDIITESLRFLSNENRIVVYGFVIMNNHFHLIWQIRGDHTRDGVQRDFLKYTGQQILKHLRNGSSPLLQALLVNAKDRKHQVWERNSLSVPLWTSNVIWQKLNYIHNNPVRAGLCENPWDYKYSSARFYLKHEKDWDFLVHIDG